MFTSPALTETTPSIRQSASGVFPDRRRPPPRQSIKSIPLSQRPPSPNCPVHADLREEAYRTQKALPTLLA
jgi:hypothetical protein